MRFCSNYLLCQDTWKKRKCGKCLFYCVCCKQTVLWKIFSSICIPFQSQRPKTVYYILIIREKKSQLCVFLVCYRKLFCLKGRAPYVHISGCQGFTGLLFRTDSILPVPRADFLSSGNIHKGMKMIIIIKKSLANKAKRQQIN